MAIRTKLAAMTAIPSWRALGRLGALVAAAGFALGAAGTAQANLVVNGGFETGTFSGWTQSGNTAFNGVFCPGPTSANVAAGNCAAFFGPIGSTGGISQTLSTVVGQTYEIKFSLQADGFEPSSFSALFGGQTLVNLTNPLALNYQAFDLFATATSTSTVLAFNFRDDPSFLFLDAVDVTVAQAAVPEPASLALLGLGLAAVAFSRRKRADSLTPP